jgi:hypothetical protein
MAKYANGIGDKEGIAAQMPDALLYFGVNIALVKRSTSFMFMLYK